MSAFSLSLRAGVTMPMVSPGRQVGRADERCVGLLGGERVGLPEGVGASHSEAVRPVDGVRVGLP